MTWSNTLAIYQTPNCSLHADATGLGCRVALLALIVCGAAGCRGKTQLEPSQISAVVVRNDDFHVGEAELRNEPTPRVIQVSLQDAKPFDRARWLSAKPGNEFTLVATFGENRLVYEDGGYLVRKVTFSGPRHGEVNDTKVPAPTGFSIYPDAGPDSAPDPSILKFCESLDWFKRATIARIGGGFKIENKSVVKGVVPRPAFSDEFLRYACRPDSSELRKAVAERDQIPERWLPIGEISIWRADSKAIQRESARDALRKDACSQAIAATLLLERNGNSTGPFVLDVLRVMSDFAADRYVTEPIIDLLSDCPAPSLVQLLVEGIEDVQVRGATRRLIQACKGIVPEKGRNNYQGDDPTIRKAISLIAILENEPRIASVLND